MIATLFLAVWLTWPSAGMATTPADRAELDGLCAALKAAKSVFQGRAI